MGDPIDYKEPTKGFLVERDTGKIIYFQYNPAGMTDNRGTNYADIVVPGMSHPKHQFISGGKRVIKFTLYLRYGGSGNGKWAQGKYYVKNTCNHLRGLTYGVREGDINKPPSVVLFNYGSLFKNLPCVVKDVNIQYTSWQDPEQLFPLEAHVDIVLEEDIEDSVSRYRVLSGVR